MIEYLKNLWNLRILTPVSRKNGFSRSKHVPIIASELHSKSPVSSIINGLDIVNTKLLLCCFLFPLTSKRAARFCNLSSVENSGSTVKDLKKWKIML